jgi:sugar/nucleoside kinase (ribokinase family)
MRLVSLGDLILDVIVGLDGPLISGDDRAATTLVGAGGQAANVAAWAASLGAEARYVGKRGADAAGELAARELASYGVEIAGPAAGRNGVVVSIAAGGERSMASDRGSATELEPGELEPAWFRCDRLHLSGYALLVEPVAGAALHAAELARAEGASISVDLSAWSLIDERFRERVRRCEPETVLATEAERDAFGPLDAAWVVKRGPDGVNVAGVDHPALPTEIVDPTGAGDAFAAGFLVGGVQLGLEAASRCCAKLGGMP